MLWGNSIALGDGAYAVMYIIGGRCSRRHIFQTAGFILPFVQFVKRLRQRYIDCRAEMYFNRRADGRQTYIAVME